MKKIHQKQDQYKVFERHGQLVFALNSEITLPQNAPVRLLSAELEELEYGKLYKAYSPRGRKSAADPRVLFKVMVHGYLCGIYSSRKLEEACQYRIDLRWLLEDQKAPDHTTFARFRTGRCREVVEDLFYQFVKKLEDMGETDHKTVYIDGTKLESAAGRYTFVWRKPIQKHLAKVKAELEKRTGLKSASAIGSRLEEERRHILFVHGSGKRKSPQQREWEEQWTLLERWKAYEGKLAIMGDGRNSYSKTDPDATFMRMKEDHMRNGQLKPGYNVQIAVNSEYITGLEAFSDRGDAKTFRPMMRRLAEKHGKPYEECVADAGYESQENYLYLAQNGQVKVTELSELLNATQTTIRTDLDTMAAENRLMRIPGGAIAVPAQPVQPPVQEAAPDALAAQKRAIAAKVLSHIQDGDTLFLNSGSTTLRVAEALCARKRLCVVTNSIRAAEVLAGYPETHVVLLGGEINAIYGFTFGDDAVQQLGRYQPAWAILSVDGVNAVQGMTTYHAEEAMVNRIMIQQAHRAIIAADRRKVGRAGFTGICRLDDRFTVITDSGAKPEELDEIRATGAAVEVAEEA